MLRQYQAELARAMLSHVDTGGKSAITALQIAADFGFGRQPVRGYVDPAATT